jgi:uncharacterized alkaline shock family protein YloU
VPRAGPLEGNQRILSAPHLAVSRGVIGEMVRLAAFEVPGVARVGHGGPAWRGWLRGSPIQARLEDGRVRVRLAIVARPGQPLAPLTAQVRAAVAGAVERLLGLELAEVSVLVDGVGG